jgi:RNA polymerase sigma-70 factor (ECF subfamily)
MPSSRCHRHGWMRMPSVTGLGVVEQAMMSDDLTSAGDAALVVAIGRWRQDALAEAFRRHAGAVLALAARVLNDRALAEEVVQEVFLRLWDQPDRFDPDRGTLRSFLLAQCHSRSVDIIRSEESRRDREDRQHLQRAEAGYDLEHEVWDLAVAEQVRDAMSGLPDVEQQAIVLAYFGGHSYREVATILDQPEGTVKTRIRSGLRRLRERLMEAGVGSVT